MVDLAPRLGNDYICSRKTQNTIIMKRFRLFETSDGRPVAWVNVDNVSCIKPADGGFDIYFVGDPEPLFIKGIFAKDIIRALENPIY